MTGRHESKRLADRRQLTQCVALLREAADALAQAHDRVAAFDYAEPVSRMVEQAQTVVERAIKTLFEIRAARFAQRPESSPTTTTTTREE
jgi:hypothetical protein